MGRTASIWRWQIFLVGCVVMIAALIAGLKPTVFAEGLFTAGLSLIVLTTLATVLTPWDRLPRRAPVVLPLLDIVAIVLLSTVNDIRIGFLWVIPVAWIATYYTLPAVFGAIVLISLGIVFFTSRAGTPTDMVLRVIISVLSLGFLGTLVRIGTRRTRASRRLMRRQAAQVTRAARRAETHERRVSQIIDALGSALVTVTEDGTITRMNDAYRELYGRDRFGDHLPSPAVEYDDRRGEPLPPERTTLARAVRGERLDGERVWLYDMNGRWRALSVTTEPIATIAGRQATTLLIIDDVTAWLEAAEERRAMSALVSHELRNPLTAIIGHVDLMREREDLPDRVQEQLAIVGGAADRMQRLVTSALDEERPDAGTLSEPLDLRQVVDASVASFLPIAEAGHLEVAVEGPETVMLYGDAFRLRQVVDNLLSNAVKYTPAEGRVTVRVGVDGCCAELVVEDTGIGLSPAELDRLFEPYFRSDRAVRTGAPGTGLGMVIVRDLVQQHHGDLDVTSAPGAGTRVTLRIPRRPAEKEPA